MRIMVVDGALRNSALAVVDTSLCPNRRDWRDTLGLGRAVRGLVATDSFSTGAGAASLLRARAAAQWLARRIAELKPDLVVFEVPAKDGAYRRVERRQKTSSQMNATSEAQMNRGMGALAAAVPPEIAVVEMRADGVGKELRGERVKQLCRMADVRPPSNEHQRDAAWYAMNLAVGYLDDPQFFKKHVADGAYHPQAQLPGLAA